MSSFYALSTTSAMLRHNGERMRGELAIAAQLAEADIVADPAMAARFERTGKDRNHVLTLRPCLRGYVFAELDDAQYGYAMRIDGVWGALKLRKRSTEGNKPAECWDTQARLFLNRLAKDRSDKERIAESRDKAAMCAYDQGQQLEITSGSLMGVLVHFQRQSQRSGDNFPMVEAETEFMGQKTTVRIDPLDVRAT